MKNRVERWLTRREVLRFGGLAGAGFLLSPIIAQRSFAQTGEVPQRVIFIMSQNGFMDDGFQAQGGGGLTLGGALEPLNRHASDATIVRGLRYRHTAGHVGGSLTFLTNRPMSPDDQNDPNTRAEGESLDYFLARTLKERGFAGPNVLLTTAAGADQWGGGEFITYEGAKKPIKAIGGADALFERVFGNYEEVAEQPDTPALPPEWKARGRQSTLDFALEEYTRLRAQLGPEEGAKLEEMADTIRHLEQDLIAQAGRDNQVACDPGTNPGGGSRDVDVFDKMNSVLVEALSCEQTLVATVRFSHGTVENGQFHEWHHGEGTPNWKAEHNNYMRWQCEQVATLVDRLKAKPAGSSTLLDNTLVLWGNEIGVNGTANYHGGEDIPAVLVGSLGGKIKTNQLIQTSGVEHSTLLVSIANAIGADIDGFGNMDGCTTGSVPGLLA